MNYLWWLSILFNPLSWRNAYAPSEEMLVVKPLKVQVHRNSA